MSSEQTLIAELVDNESLIQKYFTKIGNNLDKLKKVDPSDQKRIKTQISNDLKSTQAVLDTIKIEVQSLKEEQNEKKFNEMIKSLSSKHKQLNEEYKNSLKTDSTQSTIIDMTMQKATGSESSLEVMNKGDVILDESGKAIERMEKKVNDAKDISKNIKSDLKRQIDQLDNTNKNLKEMDYSLGRATKTLGNMAKIVATDKFVMTMIVFIMILIIAIIVYSLVSGDEGITNSITDIFGASSNQESSSKAATDVTS